MSLPAIPVYEMPAPPTTQRVTWVPEPDRAVLLVHDMQEYFLRAFDRTAEPVASLLPNIAALLATAREHGVPVVYTCQPGDQHRYRRGLLADFWGTGMSTGPVTEVVAELAPGPDDIVVTKWRYSAFERTDLRDVLARTGRDQLVVTGVYAHLGCQVTAVDAFMADVQPFLVSDAVADFGPEDHARAMDYVATGCGRVLDTTSVLDHLGRSARTLRSVAEVPTERATRYAKQLVSHLGHKTTMVDTGAGHTMHFPRQRGVAATGLISATSDVVHLEVTASDAESMATVQHVIGGHLEKFGAKENIAVAWT